MLSQHPAPSGVTAGTFRGLPITLQPWRRLRGQRGSRNRQVREDAGSQQVTSLLGFFQGCPVRVPDFLLACPDDLFSSVIFILCPFLRSSPSVCGLGGCKAFLPAGPRGRNISEAVGQSVKAAGSARVLVESVASLWPYCGEQFGA